MPSWWYRMFGRKPPERDPAPRRYLARIEAQQAEVDRLTRNLHDRRDEFTEAVAQAFQPRRKGEN